MGRNHLFISLTPRDRNDVAPALVELGSDTVRGSERPEEDVRTHNALGEVALTDPLGDVKQSVSEFNLGRFVTVENRVKHALGHSAPPFPEHSANAPSRLNGSATSVVRTALFFARVSLPRTTGRAPIAPDARPFSPRTAAS